MAAGETGASPVKSAVRTVELLEFFAGRPGMHSLADVQSAVGYPKSSLYMLLRTLVELGWVETDPTGTRYGIGVRALLVGTSYIDGDEVVAAARTTLDRLSDETTETIHLARLDGTSVVYLATRQSDHYLRPSPGSAAGCRRTPPRWARRCWPRIRTSGSGSCCRRSWRR
jgi:DNA-binding IclR family transcriptional regulator